MADFLTRLVDRAVGRAAVVEPVIAPLFALGPTIAAVSSPGTEDGALTSETDPWETLPSLQPAVPAPFPVLPHPEAPHPGGPVQPSTLAPPTASSTGTLHPHTEVELRHSPRLGMDEPTPRARAARLESAGRGDGAVQGAPPEEPRASPLRARVAVSARVRRIRPVADRPSVPVRGDFPGGVGPQTAEPSLTFEGERRQPSVAARPTIRVTIGRVDVCAEFSPPVSVPRPAKGAATSTLSLQEYLRRRSGGQR
jgi:hypothetical protein